MADAVHLSALVEHHRTSSSSQLANIAVQLIMMAAANSISATGKRLRELWAGWGDVSGSPPQRSRPRAVKLSKTLFPIVHKVAPLK